VTLPPRRPLFLARPTSATNPPPIGGVRRARQVFPEGGVGPLPQPGARPGRDPIPPRFAFFWGALLQRQIHHQSVVSVELARCSQKGAWAPFPSRVHAPAGTPSPRASRSFGAPYFSDKSTTNRWCPSSSPGVPRRGRGPPSPAGCTPRPGPHPPALRVLLGRPTSATNPPPIGGARRARPKGPPTLAPCSGRVRCGRSPAPTPARRCHRQRRARCRTAPAARPECRL